MPTNSSLRNIYDVLQRKGNTTVANTSYEYFADRMKYDDYAHTIYNALKADNPNTVKADYQRFKNIFADEAVGTKRGRTYNAPSNPNGGTRKDYLNEAGQSKPTSNTPAASTTPTSNTPAASTFNYATGEYETPIPENASPLVRALATNNFGNQNAKLKDPTNVVRSYVEENEKIAKDAVHNLTAPSRTLVRPDLPYISNTVQGAIDTFNDRLNESIGNVLSDNSIQQAIAGIVKKREDEPNSIPSQAILGMGSNPIYSSAMTAMNTQHFNDANRIAANIQNDINNTTPSLLSSPDVKAKIQAACKQLGVSEEDYTSILAQAISQQATYTFDNHLVEDEMPKSTLDYIVRGVTDSIGGKIFFGMDKRRNYARAMANQMTEEGHNPNFNGEKPGWVTRAARGAVGLVADAPLFGGMGTTANLSVRGASAVGRRLLSRSGAKWLTELSAEEFARKYATMTMAQKVGANFVRGVPTSALIGAQYGFANNFVTEATTTEDTSLGDLFLNSLKAGAGEAAVFGAIGVTGSFMRPLAQRVGITGAELTRGKQMLHGAERVGMEGLSLGVEAGTMSLAGAAVHGDDVNSQSVFENAVTILLMRLTNGHNIKNARQSLYNLTHSSEGFNTYIYGQDGKLNKYNIRLTETEAAELRNSQAGRDFIRVTTEKANGEQHVDAQANAYRAFVDDPNISLATKMKINAAFGVTNTSVPLSHHDAIDRTNKQVLDFSQDGTLLSRTPYRNASEARAIREQHSLMRSNWRMLNTFGLAVQSHSTITRPDGQMSPIAVAFLQQYGYNADKAPTDANNAKLMADLANPQSTLYKNYTKFARGFFFDEVLPEYEGQRTEIETALRKNPLSRTAKETQLLNDVMRKVKDYVAPKGKPHEKMSYADGEDKANEAGLGTANPQKQPVAEMSEEMADAMTRWQETLNTNDVIREEYNRMHKEGTSDVDIYYNLIERSGVTQEEAAPLADYINAQAKLQGMAEATQQAIETNTQLHVSQWSFKGTINGETRNGDTGLYVRDNQGRTLIVGNGIVAFDSNGRAKDECANNLLVCLDTATNQMVNVNAKDVSLVGEKSAEEFANDYRQRLTNANADVAEILNAAASVSPESTTTEKPEATAEKPEATTSPTEEKQAETAETPQATTDHATTDGQVNTEESLSPLARVPKDKNGKYDFEQVDADTAWDAIVELAQKGGSDVETATRSAKNIADQMVVKKTAELKKARSAKLRSADDVEGMIAAEAEKAARIEKAEKSLAHWKEISSTLLRRKTAEDNRKRDEEAAKAVEKNAATTEVSLEGVPDWTQDRPADARQRGYRRVNGHAVMRQSPVKTIEGKETEVKFADDVFQKGHIALVEADDLQPSHQNRQPNASHFLPEAQPKKRTDIDSVAAADKMAAHIRPSEVVSTVIAFSGAPTVNARGEAIQGNNRSAGLKTMWESHKDQADIYRNYLIEHAEEFGLTPEAIKSMKRPVLVNMVDVPDERAITLGQYDAKDIESGGTERIKPQNAVQKMGTNMRTFANLLLRTADEDASFSQLVDKNAESVLKWMQQQGYITPTQFKSAFDSKGALTAGAANDLKGILYQSIFQGANEHLEEMFNRMPAKAQRAILATAFRDYDSPESERMNTELQNSIMAFNDLMQDPDFAKATNFGEARKAIMAWARQYQFDDATGEPYLPNEKFSNFALHLAAMYKGEPQSLIQNTLNKIFDLVQGKQEADLFSQDTVDNTPRTLTEAIKEVLNIDYNGQTRSNVLGSNSPTSQEGQPGSTEPTTSGERNTQGTSNAERSPGTGGVREATAGGRRTTEGEEVDENGHAFVKSNDGSTVFGEIRETSGLAAAPIKLSEGYQDADGKGYGLAHIEANHGKQIHKAGFNSVADFVSFVAQNYDEDNIRVGKKRINGNATYLIQVTDEHDNTLFVELSRDGSYWNVNSGGVFRKGYADKKETVAKTEPQQPNNAVSSGSSLSADGQKDGITSTEPNGKPTVSAGKVSEKSKTKQEKTEENAAKSKTSQWRKTTYRGNQGEYEITVEANKVRFADLNEGDVFIDKEGGLTTLTKKLGNNEYLVSNQGRSFIISTEEGRSWSGWLQTDPKVDRVVPFDVVRRAEAETAKPREQKKNENNTPREDTEPKPIGRGAFGDIYDQFKGDAQGAIAFLTKKKGGEAVGALHHAEVGDISLVWGNEKAGLQKITKKHPEVIDDLQSVIDGMHVTQSSDNRIVLESDTHKAVVSKKLGQENTPQWLLTAYEKKDASGGSSDIVPEPQGGKQNGTAPLQDNPSAGKVTETSGTKQGKGEQNTTEQRLKDLKDRKRELENGIELRDLQAKHMEESGNHEYAKEKREEIAVREEELKQVNKEIKDLEEKAAQGNAVENVSETGDTDAASVKQAIADHHKAMEEGKKAYVDAASAARKKAKAEGRDITDKEIKEYVELTEKPERDLEDYLRTLSDEELVTEAVAAAKELPGTLSKMRMQGIFKHEAIRRGLTQERIDELQSAYLKEQQIDAQGNPLKSSEARRLAEERAEAEREAKEAEEKLKAQRNEQRKEKEQQAAENLQELVDFHKHADSTGRTSPLKDAFIAEDLILPLSLDGKASRLAVETFVPDDILLPSHGIATYSYADEIDERTDTGWQKWGDLLDKYNSQAEKNDKGYPLGDAAAIQFRTVDAAVKFADWVKPYEKNTKENTEPRKEARGEGTEPQPIGKGTFGDIFDQFKGKVKEAFDFLTKRKSGDLLGVFHREDTGDIDLVWGDENGGLSHVISKHVGEGKDFATVDDAMQRIDKVLREGKLIQDGALRYVVSEDGYRVAIRKDYNGKKKNWVVTAIDYNRSKEEKGITTNPTSASHGANGSELAVPSNSAGKDTKVSDTKQTSGEKIDDYGEKIAGARKDMLRDYAKTLENANVESFVALPLAKAFKRPNLKKLVEVGALREKDARFAEAVLANHLSQGKPRLLTRSRYAGIENTVDIRNWAERCAEGADMLRTLFGMDEAERDKFIEEVRQRKAYDEEAVNKRKSQLAEWNPGQKFEGTCYGINPVALFMDVYSQLGYDGIGDVKLPIVDVKPDSTFDSYELTAANGKGFYSSRPLQSYEDVVDEIVYQTKRRNGDSDNDHPTSVFRVIHGDPIEEVNDYYVSTFPSLRSTSPTIKYFNTKEEADAYANAYMEAHEKGSAFVKEHLRVVGYKEFTIAYRCGEGVANEKAARYDTTMTYATPEEARAAIVERHDELNDFANAKDAEAFTKSGEGRQKKDYVYIHSYTSDGGKTWTYAIVLDDKYNPHKSVWNTIPYALADGFKTRKEAEKYLEDHRAEWDEKIADINRQRRAFVYFDGDAKARVGEDYRKGEDVTAEQFATQFGFRGVQFGNWTNQNDRQAAINNAFDGFMDLAKLLGVSPRALSLNGELGIAFGARGTGKASAHYELQEVVINLTKTKGAGSLAHEWWHALDSYFARQGGVALGMVTNSKGITMRDELRKAFNTLIDHTANSDYDKRSAEYGKSYWGARHEETARMFETWVNNELLRRGERNHFLVGKNPNAENDIAEINYFFYKWSLENSIHEPMSFEEFKKTPMALSGYVYPSRAELETFGKDLRRIFDTVQERVDEETGNVVMYHRGNVVTNTTSQEQALLNAVVEQVRKAGIEVVTDVAEGQRVLDMANGNNANVRTQAMTDKLTKAASTIKGWLQKGSRGKSFTIELPTATQRMVRNAMGRDFDSHNITANGIAHALKNHGENGNKIGENSIPLRNEDMELIPYIMTAPDYVREGSSDATGRKSVRFYKDLSNGYVVVVEKEYKNSPDDMETITMWAEKSSSEATNARRNAPDTHVQNATLSTEDAAKIRKDAETAIANDRNLREQRVYHGSGADFDHFDHSHMGEGEGAQAYGWGTYVTEVEGIGRSYAKAVRNKGVTVQVRENGIWREIDKSSSDYSISQEAAQLIGDYGNYKEAVRFADRWRETANTEEIRNHWQAVYDFLKAHKSKDIKVKEDHYLYTIEIPDDNGTNYLDYTKILVEQGYDVIDKISDALKASGWWGREISSEDGVEFYFSKDGKPILFELGTTGRKLYEELEDAFGSDKAASKFLSEAGFTGIKYPADNLRGGRSDGASNYVIFNEADAKITDHVRFFKTPNGEAYGYTVGGKIYIDPRIATAETPIHEYAHLWAEALRGGNAKEWKNVVELMKGTSVWDEVKKKYPELKTDDEIADEVIAQYSGRRGAERLREEQRKIAEGKGSVAEKSAAIRAIESVKQALKKFWQGVCDFLHIHYTSAEEVADRVMKDLLDGVNPNDFIKGKASDRVRKQFIGEKGAREADHAEEVTTRLDNLDVARQMEEAKKEAKASGIQQYRELSGEVESRNVQSRMGMTAEERRQSLASETEDVSREDQIFLFDEDGTNASMAEQRPKEQRLQKLRESKPIEITGREVKPSEDLKEYKKNALEYGKGLQGTYTNKDTGMTVKLQRGRHNGGVNEVLQHDYKDIPHLQSVAAIPQIIENGIYIDSRQNADKAKNPNVSEYQYYVCGLKIGGEDYTVRSTIAVDTKGNRYYDHKLTSIEKGKLLDIIDEAASQGGNGFGTTPDTKSTTNSAGKDKVLMSILQTKGAKSDDVSTTPQPNTAVIKHIEGVSKKIGAKVNVVNSIDEVNNAYVSDQIKRGRNITGWYDETTDEVYLYMPNIHDRYTAEKTIWHETVGHKGLRALLKDQFRPFLRSLWLDKTSKIYDDLHKYVRENLHKNNFDLYDTIEEYLAKTAESGKGEQGFWPNVRQRLNAALHGIGYRLSPNASDARYMLWLSKNIQKHAGDTTWEMRAARARWNIEHDTPETSVSNGVFGNHSGDMASWTKTEFDDATDGRIHLRTSPTTATAIDRYNKALAAHGYMASEAYLDNMISLKKLMEAALPKTKIEDIPASENPYLLKTPTDAAIGESRQRFEHDIMAPLETTTAKCLDAFSGNTTERLREFNLYLIKKSGAERNRVLFVRDHINSLRENDRTSADSLQTAWNAKKKQLGDRLRNGNIALDGYYQELDDYIRQNVDPNYQPGEHDYSGIHGVYNITDSKAPYDDSRLLSEIMDTEARIGKENVDTLWKQMRTATIYAVDTDYKAGINDKATHDHVADMFDWYVPMRGSEAPVAEEVYGYITKNGLVHTSIGAAIKQAKGHTELSDTNVIAQIGAMGNSAIARYGDMVIKQAFARFVRNHKGELDGLVTEMQIWEEKVGVDNQGKDIWQEVQPQIPEKATPDEVAKIVSDFESDMQSKKIGGTARVQTSKGNVPYKFANEQDRSQHIIDVMIAGRKHRFVINSNPRAAQALNGLLENKTLSKTFAAIQRFQAQTYTSWSPEFVQRNAMRDASFALTNILIKENPVYVARALSYYLAVNPFYGFAALRPSQLSGRENNGLGLYGLYRRGKLNPYIKIHRYFKEFMENGGTTGWVQILSMDEWTKKYKVDIKAERNPIKVGQFLRSFILGNVEHLNEAIENWARFAVYCASRDSGRGVTRSAYDAKEVSTNFNRHGSGNAISSFVRPNMGKGAETRRGFYSATSAYLRNFSVFFNAGAQSTNLLLKNIKNHPGRTAFWMIGFNFALGALIPVINNCLIAVEDEDERNGVADPYGELPDYIRRNNLCIYKGQGDFFTYPLAIENRAFYGLGDLAAGLLYRPEIAGQKTPWLDAVGCLSQLLPGQDYLNGGEIDKAPATAIVKAYVPTPTSPLVEWLMNSDWKGSPIERRSDFLENDPAWKKSYGNTLPIFIDLNKWVNAQTNTVDHGNPEMKGNETLDALTNPSMLETLFGGYLGGTYTFARRAYNAATTDADLIPGEIPFLRTVHYTPSERSAMMRTRTKWYNYKEQYDVTQRNVQKLKSRNVPWDERIGNIAAYQRFTNSRDFEALRIIQLADKQIQRIKKVSKLNNDPEAVQLLQQQTDLIMQDAVRKLDALQAE